MRLGDEPFYLDPLHHRRIVRIRHQHVLRIDLMRVANHCKQAVALRHAVNCELGVENLVAAVLAVGLREHHQLHIGGVAFELREGLHQIVNLVIGQGQTELGIGCQQRRSSWHRPATQHVHMRHGCGLQFGEQLQGLRALEHDTLSHAVVQQGCYLRQLLRAEHGPAQQRVFQGEAVFHNPLNPTHCQAAVVRNVGGFGRPRRHRAETWRHHD